MISDLVEAEVVERLVTRTAQNLGVELDRLVQKEDTALAGANAAGTSEEAARAAKAALEEWQLVDAPLERSRPEPVKLPRTLVPSLLQSAYEEFFLAAEMTATAPEVQGLSSADIPATDKNLDANAREFLLGRRDYLGGRWFTRFAERDLRFLTWGAAAKIATRIAGRKRPFTKQPPKPFTMSNRLRLVVVGDWGSGVPRAQQLGTVMRKSVTEAKDQNRECHVIHLGDVYYTGESKEYDRRFLASWPVVTRKEAETIGSWCLNANHDMFSGGYDYFDYLLADPRFARQERCSFFCLENDYWQILGLDSAYDDADLCEPQADWIHQNRQRAPAKKGILMSHHQPFSAFEKSSDTLLQRLKPVLDPGLVKAWFWGHEHRCALYEPRFGIQYPRLAGHGGVPVWAPTTATPAGVFYEFRESFPAYIDEEFARFGFVQLDFDDAVINVSYIKEQGWAHHTERMV